LRREGRKRTAWLVGRSNFIISPVPVHGGAEDDKKENRRWEGNGHANGTQRTPSDDEEKKMGASCMATGDETEWQ